MWVARDKDGSLWAYTTKPVPILISQVDSYWASGEESGSYCELDSSYFPEITFDTSPVWKRVLDINVYKNDWE